jgi:hypothetical protein
LRKHNSTQFPVPQVRRQYYASVSPGEHLIKKMPIFHPDIFFNIRPIQIIETEKINQVPGKIPVHSYADLTKFPDFLPGEYDP